VKYIGRNLETLLYTWDLPLIAFGYVHDALQSRAEKKKLTEPQIGELHKKRVE
jgi:hypothetical protein